MKFVARPVSLVSASQAPDAPYPANTKAKGWRFELDYERIEQSDTWALSPAEMRPWLLMLWMTAWKQVPCGSLPSTDELIAARIGMDIRQLKAHRDILMRGWYLASDGRMYHHVIAEQVLGLIDTRVRDRKRQEEYRNKQNQALADQCHTLLTQSRELPTLPEPEPEPNPKKKREEERESPTAPSPTRPPPKSTLQKPNEVPEQIWTDWLTLRRAKKAPVTETTVAGARAEAAKAGMPLADFLAEWCARGSQGLKAEWLTPAARATASPPMKSFAQQEREHGMERWEKMTGRIHPERSGIVDVVAQPIFLIGSKS